MLFRSWENLELSCQVISEIPELYVETVRQLISAKKQLKMVVSNRTTNVFNFSNSINFNVSTQCADGFMLAPIPNSGLTSYYGADTSQLEAPCFTFGWTQNPAVGSPTLSLLSAIQLSLRCGQYAIPQTGSFQKLYNLPAQTNESIFGDSIFAQNSMWVNSVSTTLPYLPGVGESGWISQNAVFYEGLCALQEPGFQHESAVLSGINTQGIDQNFNVSLAPDASFSTANTQMFLGVVSSATAIFDSETGSISVIH